MFNPYRSALKRLARLRRSPVVVRRCGATFVLDPQNWIDNRLIAGAHYEAAQIDNAAKLIAARNLDLVIDIGANFGLYSILLGKIESVANVFAFEPVRRNYAQLQANIFANGLERKIDARRIGISDRKDYRFIYIDPRSTGVSRLDMATSKRDIAAFADGEEIDVAPLDDILCLSRRRAFVKIDVEGHAAEVIAGMRKFLERNSCIIQIEVTTDAERCALSCLIDSGYFEMARIDNDVIVAHKDYA